MNRRIVLAGNVIADVVIEIPALPERGGDVLGTHSRTTTGGGFNTLVAARRLGAEAVYAGLHGTGPHGDLVRAALAAEEIGTLLPARTDRDTGFTVALVDSGGERTFVTSFGAEATLAPADLTAVGAQLRPDDLVQLSGYGLALPGNGPLLSGLTAVLPAGSTLCLDPGPLVADIPEHVLAPVLARTDWLSANAREARIMTGHEDPRTAAAALVRRLSPGAGVLVRADKDGCWLAAPGRSPVHVPGFPVTAVDSNGAGDAHVGAFLALLGQGFDPLTAAHGANAAAAFAVTRRGPATAPDRAELAAFLADDPLAAQLS
ncbi:PfkB family carbohydrate kinase [Streptomyces sp. Ag109_O5-10]|uniref:PfkB family carbohydrate kinase n=1 Tax=Streptomyces sp. Ag109_O5-10 TaxID=1855349 RepID=UPI000897A36D|nr:PfkB family carbohydrate kinase [Streptomyces sp. Ag109_O5-10]SED71646.1 Sugar or nucleoside kinase, ribokinase family [Streptomyces sp. Ag109_O5-10]